MSVLSSWLNSGLARDTTRRTLSAGRVSTPVSNSCFFFRQESCVADGYDNVVDLMTLYTDKTQRSSLLLSTWRPQTTATDSVHISNFLTINACICPTVLLSVVCWRISWAVNTKSLVWTAAVLHIWWTQYREDGCNLWLTGLTVN